jgi:hypothetical protein
MSHMGTTMSSPVRPFNLFLWVYKIPGKADLKLFASPLRVLIFFFHAKKKTVSAVNGGTSQEFTITGGRVGYRCDMKPP